MLFPSNTLSSKSSMEWKKKPTGEEKRAMVPLPWRRLGTKHLHGYLALLLGSCPIQDSQIIVCIKCLFSPRPYDLNVH